MESYVFVVLGYDNQSRVVWVWSGRGCFCFWGSVVFSTVVVVFEAVVVVIVVAVFDAFGSGCIPTAPTKVAGVVGFGDDGRVD